MARVPRASKIGKTPVKPRLDIESFRYLEDLKVELPALVLAVQVPQDAFGSDYGHQHAYRFKEGRQWLRIAHQHGQGGRHQSYYLATVLRPKDAWIAEKLNRLGDYSSELADGTLQSISDYNDNLRIKVGVHCNHSWRDFDLGRYPIDVEQLPQIAADTLPSNLDDLIEWETGTQRASGSTDRWKLLVLSTIQLNSNNL